MAFLTLFECVLSVSQYKSKHVHVPKYTRFRTTGYARVLLFMFIRRELGGTGTGCLFQFTYCVTVIVLSKIDENRCKQTVASLP